MAGMAQNLPTDLARAIDEAGYFPALVRDVVAKELAPRAVEAEASATFSHDLLPQLLGLDAMTAPWQHALEVFDTTSAAVLGPA